MNIRSLEKVRAASKFIAENRAAVTIARPHLADSVGKAVDILAQLADGKLKTTEELGTALEMNHESVRQILKALQWNPDDGGILIQASSGNSKSAGFKLPNGKILWKPPESFI